MKGMFAKSKAGHDKNQLYIIYEETEEYVYLVDGIYKTVEKPKKKKKKHVQPIYKMIDTTIVSKIENKLPVQNEEIKRAIRLYLGGIACQKQM